MKIMDLFESAPQTYRVVEALLVSNRSNVLNNTNAIKDFKRMSNTQRHGGAEVAMVRETKRIRDTVPQTGTLENHHLSYTNYLEHVGDLTHRLGVMMTEPTKNTIDDDIIADVFSGIEHCIPKIQNAVNSYFFRDWPKTQKELLSHVPNLKDFTRGYVSAHKKIPVFNKVQYHAREAAVALGQVDLGEAHHHLNTLNTMINNRSAYVEACFYEKKSRF